MNDEHDPTEVRRKLLKVLGGSLVLVPLAALQGCSGEKEPAPATTTPKTGAAPAAKPATSPPPKSEPMEVKPTAPATTGEPLPHLNEGDPQAKALGYRHNAAQVESSKYPRFEAGQLCKNCALYQDSGDAEWVGCSLFPGKAVNANGWCSAYVPKV